MIQTSDLKRLVSELATHGGTEVMTWAEKNQFEMDALECLSHMFGEYFNGLMNGMIGQRVEEDELHEEGFATVEITQEVINKFVIEVSMHAFCFGWEARKQYGTSA